MAIYTSPILAVGLVVFSFSPRRRPSRFSINAALAVALAPFYSRRASPAPRQLSAASLFAYGHGHGLGLQPITRLRCYCSPGLCLSATRTLPLPNFPIRPHSHFGLVCLSHLPLRCTYLVLLAEPPECSADSPKARPSFVPPPPCAPSSRLHLDQAALTSPSLLPSASYSSHGPI